jgi:hypothetical protein
MFDPVFDLFRGKAVTIPPMDGAFRPNTALDEADAVLEIEAPDNLCFDGDRVLFSSGRDVFALPVAIDAKPVHVAHYDAPVTAIAARGSVRAAALDDGTIVVDDGNRRRMIGPPDGFACPTALAFSDSNALFVCHGSSRHRASDWVVDLIEKNATGAVWKIDLAAGAQTCLARTLAFPCGVLVGPKGLVVSEAWQHRLTLIRPGESHPETIAAKLPGYPSRLSPAADSGAWLALFAPRSRLIEFILREDDYRADMMREVPRHQWIVPALASGTSFLEPLQCGGVKTMGIHKPWSPSRSYGLAARLDADLRPIASFHSRADGTRHGITSVVEAQGLVLASAKGGNAIIGLAGGN